MVIVEVLGNPLQPFDIGVTVINAVMLALVVLTAVNELMVVPEPAAASPIVEILLVQLYTVPGTGEPEKVIATVVNPLHTACEGGLGISTDGVGKTVTVTENTVGLVQPLAVRV
jgi:hypothetical protein